MRLYIDDDTVDGLLVKLLRQACHDVQIPSDVGRNGAADPVHLAYAVSADRVLLSHNHKDFKQLHDLIVTVAGHYPGILIVRKDNDARDLKPPGIVRALGKLSASRVTVADQLVILNHLR